MLKRPKFIKKSLASYHPWLYHLMIFIKRIERHHHSFDPFLDTGRVLPFASGAIVMYNYRDLRFTTLLIRPFS